jgi:hypothetical protein
MKEILFYSCIKSNKYLMEYKSLQKLMVIDNIVMCKHETHTFIYHLFGRIF